MRLIDISTTCGAIGCREQRLHWLRLYLGPGGQSETFCTRHGKLNEATIGWLELGKSAPHYFKKGTK